MYGIWTIVPLLSLAFAPAATEDACSMMFPDRIYTSDVHFIGRAVADTVFAGPGPVRHVDEDSGRPIFGQRVRIERIGGPAAAGLPTGVTEVVVVPWAHDEMCRPLVWDRSARWLWLDLRGFYIARLRAPEHWADGVPTVDVHNPGHVPRIGGRLTLDELFDRYQDPSVWVPTAAR